MPCRCIWREGFPLPLEKRSECMGIYLNSIKSCALYESESLSPYFVDKSAMLRELIPLAEQGNQYVCILRPCCFGKTIMANMISAFLEKVQTAGKYLW